MGCGAGIRGADGVVLAADRRVLDGHRVRSDDLRSLETVDNVAIAVVGEPSGVQGFHREIRADIRSYELEHDRQITMESLTRLASEDANQHEVSVILAAPGDDGTARLRQIDACGGSIDDDRVAIGEPKAVVLGLLEQLDRDTSVSELVDTLTDRLEQAAARHVAIGGELDVAVVSDTS